MIVRAHLFAQRRKGSMISRACACASVCWERVGVRLYRLAVRAGTPVFAVSNIHEVGSVPRQRSNSVQMTDFRIADPRANSRFASRRFPVIYGSTTRPPGVKFSNDFSRVGVCVCVLGGGRAGGRLRWWMASASHCGPPACERSTANLFAVSVTMSIRRCSFSCRSGMFTLSVTR